MDKKIQRVVFFVGADMCGKTEIARELSWRIDVPYFKASSEFTTFLNSRGRQGPPQNDRFLNQLLHADPRVFDLLKQTGHSVIFDRGFPCEWVYSSVLGRKTDINAIVSLDECWASLGACIIFCNRSSYAGITDDADPTIGAEILQKLHDKYVEFGKWTRCRFMSLNVDDENLQREIGDITKFLASVQG